MLLGTLPWTRSVLVQPCLSIGQPYLRIGGVHWVGCGGMSENSRLGGRMHDPCGWISLEMIVRSRTRNQAQYKKRCDTSAVYNIGNNELGTQLSATVTPYRMN